MTDPILAGPEQLLQAFRNAKAEFDRGQTTHDGLICKVGSMSAYPTLKLQKASWTNDSMDVLPNKTGIFFSIWQDDKCRETNRLLYNIHALKLRLLKEYAIASRDFAAAFRSAFAPHARSWPNVSVEFGPLTLMQGWKAFEPTNLEQTVRSLMREFEAISPTIDALLNTSRRSK